MRYKNFDKDQFFEEIYEFGIRALHFNKKELLEELLPRCRKELYLSGYRLILLSEVSSLLTSAVERGVKVRVVVVPPWCGSFQMVYGTEKVIDNYCRVFRALAPNSMSTEDIDGQCEVRFVGKPLFSDTYQVDNHLITGPYLHNKTPQDGRITAGDFFTYDIDRRSQLHDLVQAENDTLWDEAEGKLDWGRFLSVDRQIQKGDFTEKDKIDLMKSACISL